MVFRSSGASTLCLSGFKRFCPCPYVMVYGNSLCPLYFRVDSRWYEWFIGYLSLFTFRSSLLTLCDAGGQSAGPISHSGKCAYLLLFQFLHYSVCHLAWLLGPPGPCDPPPAPPAVLPPLRIKPPLTPHPQPSLFPLCLWVLGDGDINMFLTIF